VTSTHQPTDTAERESTAPEASAPAPLPVLGSRASRTALGGPLAPNPKGANMTGYPDHVCVVRTSEPCASVKANQEGRGPVINPGHYCTSACLGGAYVVECLTCGPIAEHDHLAPAQIRAETHSKARIPVHAHA
jgi:hypothetical protein